MKVAVPTANGSLAMHFGHCDQFAIIEVDDEGNILSREDKTPPLHEPGVLPEWLHTIGVTDIIAGGMGTRAMLLFRQNGINVIIGAPSTNPETLAEACAKGTLDSGDNICSH